jgi:hypothetical protein
MTNSLRLCRFLACPVLLAASLSAQQQAPQVDRGKAYYAYSMGHLYSELAGAYGNRGEYLNKAIDNYRDAMKAAAESAPAGGMAREAIEQLQKTLDKPADLAGQLAVSFLFLTVCSSAGGAIAAECTIEDFDGTFALVGQGTAAGVAARPA